MNKKQKTYVGLGAVFGTSALMTGVHMIGKKMRCHRERNYIKNFVSHHTGHNQYLIDTVDQLTAKQVTELSQLIRQLMGKDDAATKMGNIDQRIHHIINEIEKCVKEANK